MERKVDLIEVDTGVVKTNTGIELLKNSGGTIDGDINVVGNLQENGNNVLTTADTIDADTFDGLDSSVFYKTTSEIHYSNIDNALATLPYNVVGQVAFMYYSGVTTLTLTPNSQISGSNLRWVGLVNGAINIGGGIPSGTWVCLGYAPNGASTLFRRIA